MNRIRIAVNLAVFAVLFLVMVSWAVRNVVSVEAIENPYRVSATFASAFGALPNAEVTYRGVPYGSISDVDRVPGGVRVTLKVKRTLQLPEGTRAHLLRKSVVGEPYVDLSPPEGWKGGGPWLRPGAVIPIERTTVPLEFSELLRSASTLVQSIPPADVSTLLHEAATGLVGRADSLRQLAESGDRLSASLAARTETLDRLMTNGTRLTHVITEHRGSLGQSLADLEQVAATLRSVRNETGALLDQAAPLLTQVADLVADHKANLDCDIKILERVVEELNTPRRLAELNAVLEIGPGAFKLVEQASDVEPDGRWIRVGQISNPETNKPRYYDPPKPHPTPPDVETCRSPLRPVLVAGSSQAGGGGGSLPATGGAGTVATGLALLGLVVFLRRARAA